jgi:dienelactone hydrolase
MCETAAGCVTGSAVAHTPDSLAAMIAQASLALPASVTGAAPYLGLWRDAPPARARAPVVIFLHGSMGLALPAVAEWQAWIAELGYACVAPDSFALPGRLTYKSPVDVETYERIHTLRASEIAPTLTALRAADWADVTRIALAGSSEGGPAVARCDDPAFVARIVYAWSCEDNYFVRRHATRVLADQPILNVMGGKDAFFAPGQPFLGNPHALGHAGETFADARRATVTLIPGAPHTILNTPQARAATRAFLEDAFKR